MATYLQMLAETIKTRFADSVEACYVAHDEITVEITPSHLKSVCLALRDEAPFKFEQLMDVCGIDYLYYGRGEWVTEAATTMGFERGVDRSYGRVFLDEKNVEQVPSIDGTQSVPPDCAITKLKCRERFAAVYHILSISLNHRLRIRVFLPQAEPVVDSVVEIWKSADWFEREAFDLYGIMFKGHPDLRRILTDYGFIGHPFRKDFPLIGEVEMRYDASAERVIYEPVSIVARTLVPKVIRDDSRYIQPTVKETEQGK